MGWKWVEEGWRDGRASRAVCCLRQGCAFCVPMVIILQDNSLR